MSNRNTKKAVELTPEEEKAARKQAKKEAKAAKKAVAAAKKAERRQRSIDNHTRDFFTDYYKTGRQFAKENEERYKQLPPRKRKGILGWNKSEITMLVVIIVGAILIVLKYFVF